jgi:excisionase family DNA binding protein
MPGLCVGVNTRGATACKRFPRNVPSVLKTLTTFLKTPPIGKPRASRENSRVARIGDTNKQKTKAKNMTNDESKKPMPEPLVYTVEETAAVLKISTKSVRRLLARGFLTGSKALRKILIPRQQVLDFLKAACDVPKTVC